MSSFIHGFRFNIEALDHIHPVIRCYRGAARSPYQRFALPDHLDNDWRGEVAHARLLGRWFRDELEAPPRTVASRA